MSIGLYLIIFFFVFGIMYYNYKFLNKYLLNDLILYVIIFDFL